MFGLALRKVWQKYYCARFYSNGKTERRSVMSMRKIGAVMVCTGLLVTILSACQSEGPAEQAGKEIDKTAEQAGEAMEKPGERAGEAME
jgi:hypothetical protein